MACQTTCECRNASEYAACTENVPCGSDYCQESPCAYAILSPCDMGGDYTTDDLSDPTRLLRPRLRWITMLWRDCLFSNTWSARYGMYFYTGVGNPCIMNGAIPLPDVCEQGAIVDASGVEYPSDLLPTGQVDDDCDYPCVRPYIPRCRIAASDTNEHLSPMHFGCGPMPQDVHGGSSDHCGWGDQYNSSSLHSECNSELKVWVLDIRGLSSAGPDAIGAHITVYAYRDVYASDAGGGATGMIPILDYICTDFQCLGRSTFNFAGYYEYTVGGVTQVITGNPVYKGYPERLCVTAYSSRYLHKCTTAADACACEDAGWSTILVPNNITCDNTGSDYLTLTRTYDTTLVVDGIDITAEACGIPTGPCGYFYGGADTTCGTPGTDPNRFIIYFLWCDGSQWKYRVCCVKLTSNVSGESTGIESVDVVCDGNYTKPEACVMTNVWDAIPCDTSSSGCCDACAPTVDIPCCGTPVPQTLYATLTAANCATLNGTVITLNYDGDTGGVHFWSGDFTPSNPNTCTTPLTFHFKIIGPTACEFVMWLTDGSGTQIWGNSASTGMGAITCPFTSVTNSSFSTSLLGCIERIMAPVCFGTMTATVSV